MDKNNIEEIYRLTPMQEGMFFHQMMPDSETEYIIQKGIRITGRLNPDFVRRAVDYLSELYPVLRTSFVMPKKDDRPWQVILKDRRITVDFEESKGKYASMEEAETLIMKADLEKGFDLVHDSLMRITICELEDDRYFFLMSVHHIIIDGWCLMLLFNDLIGFYEMLERNMSEAEISAWLNGKKKKLPVFSDYIRWIGSKNREEGIEYWRNILDGYNDNVGFTKSDGVSGLGSEVNSLSFEYDSSVYDKLKDFSAANRVSRSTVLEAAWGILLQKYSFKKDVVFGNVVSGRNNVGSGVNEAVGMYVNTVPLRVKNEDDTFSSLLRKISEQSAGSNEFYYCSLADIQKATGNQQLFSTLFAHENYYIENRELRTESGITFVPSGMREETNYPITLCVYTAEKLSAEILFRRDGYAREEVEAILRNYGFILNELMNNPDEKISSVAMTTKEEKLALRKFNDTVRIYPKGASVGHLFELTAEKYAEKTAVIYQDNKITYGELNRRANRIARLLLENGVGTGEPVMIIPDKSIEAIASLIGILKAGGAYVPIDSSYPEERIRVIEKDCNSKIILKGRDYAYESEDGERLILNYDDPYTQYDDSNVNIPVSGENPAYIIYTSGTTGKPKGSIISHKSINRLVINTDYVELSDKTVIFQTGALAFDASTFEVWGSLLNGGTLCLAGQDILLDAPKFKKAIRDNKINTMWLTSSLFNQMEEQDTSIFATLDNLLIGGERLSEAHVSHFKKAEPAVRLINGYGPTEATTFTCCYTIPDNFERIYIGYPIANTQVYIIQDGNLCARGMAGELYIGGDGVSQGYLNMPELTRKRFIQNPFGRDMLYASGDMARWTFDGRVDYLGRVDQQVKIRGYRIEPEDIENSMERIEGIRSAVVRADRNAGGELELNAWYAADRSISSRELKDILRAMLPAYMIPKRLMQVDAIPTTMNGKKNRSILTVTEEAGTRLRLPQNGVQEKLAEIFRRILAVGSVDIETGFFDLGGHSLKAMSLINSIEREFGKRLTLRDIYTNSSIVQLEKLLSEEAEEEKYQPIPVAEKRDKYEMSSAQLRLYLINDMTKYDTLYNIPAFFRIEGEPDFERAETALKRLVKRHEILRTHFVIEDGVGYQRIDEEVPVSIKMLEEEYGSLQEMADEFVEPFDYGRAPLFRLAVGRTVSSEKYLLFDMSHIISDGMSMVIFMREFIDLYEGKEPAPLTAQYKDYGIWAESLDLEKERAYWKKQFEDELPVLNFPCDFQRPGYQEFSGKTLRFDVPGEIREKVAELAHRHNTTEYSVLFAAFALEVSRYSSQEDLVIGTPVSGRVHKDTEQMLGNFVNTLAIRCKPSGDMPFSRFLDNVAETMTNAFDNQVFPFEKLVAELNPPKDTSKNPIFDIMFVMQNNDSVELKMGDVSFVPADAELNISKFDFTLAAYSTKDGYSFTLEYSDSLFLNSTMVWFTEHYKNLLAEITGCPDRRLNEYSMLGEGEENLILNTFNATATEYPKQSTVKELFEEQVSLSPDAIAAEYGEEKVTYSELNEMSDSVAGYLIKNGVCAGDSIAVLANKGIKLVAAIIGILKCGAVYVPIDTNYPKERIAFILRDSSARFLLSYRVDTAGLDGTAVIDLEKFSFDRNAYEPVRAEGSMPAYIIYTSGTTGNPKGTVIANRSIIRLVRNTNFYPFSSDMTVLQTGSVAFDASTFEIWGTLLNGGRLCLADNDILMNAGKLKEQIYSRGVNTMWMTSSLFNQIVEEDTSTFEGLKYLLIGGEKLSEYHVKKFRRMEPFVKLINGYGPTENTTFTTTYEIPARMNRIPIGYLISNTTGYIMKDGSLCGIGVPGELMIGGDGLTEGYLNRPELNEKKFISNPFGPGRLYRSGDLVKWNEDGSIDYLGRIDNQIKIRGFRVELEEIEKAMLGIGLLKEAAVNVETEQNEKRLVAYYVADAAIGSDVIISELEKTLPSYMIPVGYLQMDRLPVTNNGKIDRRKLPKIQNSGSGTVVEKPVGQTEAAVAECFCSVLGIDEIGRNDDFFRLGGHSLKAMLVINRLEEKCGVRMTLMDFFKAPRVSKIAEFIDGNKRTYEPVPRLPKAETYSVSPAQNRMFILKQFSEDTLAYNMPLLFRIRGVLDRARADRAYDLLLQQEEILRTGFRLVNDEPVQVISDHAEGQIKYLTVSDDTDIVQFAKSLIRPFDFSQAPLMRIFVITRDNGESYFMVDMHHIISDGASMGILVKEFIRLYQGGEKAEKNIYYKDFAGWVNGRSLENQEGYWDRQFAEEVTPLDIVTDFHRPSFQRFEGKTVRKQIDNALYGRIKEVCHENGITEYMFFTASLGILLSRYSGQEDIVLGTSTAGRVHPDTLDCIGMFVNTLPLRLRTDREQDFERYLVDVRKLVLGALENQEYPFEKMADRYVKNRDSSRNPLFDVLFIMQNNQIDRLETEDFSCEQIDLDLGIAKFDLTFVAEENSDGVRISLEYAVSLFREEMMELMLAHYIELITSICADTAQKLKSFNMVTEEERNIILNSFNDINEPKPMYASISQRFSEMAVRWSDRTAVVCGSESLTYGELDEQSNRIANALSGLGVGSGDPVAVIPNKETAVIPTILGIIKCGAAYVPIDINYPNERISLVLEDCAPKAVIYSRYLECFDGYRTLKLGDSTWYSDNTGAVKDVSTQESLAYIIYTSGTTGRPKGSMIEQKSILRLVISPNYVRLDENTSILQTGALAFDASTLEIWGALLNGGKLCIAETDVLFDGERFKNTLTENKVNTMWLTSSLFNQLEEQDCSIFASLEYLLIGGEKLSERHVFDFMERMPQVQLINGYGPTENTTFTTTYALSGYTDGAIPIGSRINNTQVYVMNGDTLCGIGEPGELCTGGLGVSRGYLNRPELNSEKFIENPFGEGRLYRTDDIVRFRKDGNLEYLGRKDDQVKIRGFRVETTEIEYVLQHMEGITHAVVCVRVSENGDKYLTAHFCADHEVDIHELKHLLKEQLPSYMIPAYMMQIDQMPLTINGKINKRALPEIEAVCDEEICEAQNDVQAQLLDVIKEVLGNTYVGVNSDFFEYGGDSIKAIRAVSKIRELGFDISVKDVMTYKTVEEISKHVTNWKESYSQEEITGEVGLLPIQKVFFEKNMPKPEYFNQTMVVQSDKRLEVKYLEKAFDALTVHHDMLRAQYKDNIQTIRGSEGYRPYSISVLDYSASEKTDEGALTEACEAIQGGMDLENGPLVRIALIRLREKDHLMISCHHLVVDGVSWRILLEDFIKAYDQASDGEEIKLPLKLSSYRDWSGQLLEYKNSQGFDRERSYWSEINGRVRKCNEGISLKAKGEYQTSSFSISPELSENALRKIHAAYNTNINDILLSALAMALKEWMKQEEFPVMLEGHGRSSILGDSHIERTVGWFTAMYPIIISSSDDVRDTVIRTKDMLRKIPSEGLGYGLCRFDGEDYQDAKIAFNYLGEMDSEISDNGWLHVSGLNTGRSISAENTPWQELSINCMCAAKCLNMEITYDSGRFTVQEIDSLFDYYNKALEKIVNHCTGKDTERTITDFGVYDMSDEDMDLLNSIL